MINLIKSLTLAILIAVILPSLTFDVHNHKEKVFSKIAHSSIEGIYTGMLTYVGSGGNMITNIEGTATITKSRNTYVIAFSNNVPSLKELIFKNNDGSYASISSENSMTGIDVDGNNLSIVVIKNGNNWAFSGKK